MKTTTLTIITLLSLTSIFASEECNNKCVATKAAAAAATPAVQTPVKTPKEKIQRQDIAQIKRQMHDHAKISLQEQLSISALKNKSNNLSNSIKGMKDDYYAQGKCKVTLCNELSQVNQQLEQEKAKNNKTTAKLNELLSQYNKACLELK